MRRFQFSLQALLTVRRQHEQAALEGYASALSTRQRALAAAGRAEQRLADGWKTFQAQLEATCEAACMRQTQRQCSALMEQREATAMALMNAEGSLQQAFAQFLEARRRREAVDRLEERQKRQYARELARQEHKILDELALRRTVSEEALLGQ